MDTIKVSLDTTEYKSKPQKGEIGNINNRIPTQIRELSLHEFADLVGNRGCTFAPAVFDGARKSQNVREVQLLCLDFDNKENIITLDEALARSNRLDLPVAFAYETFSSHNCNKFRIVYRYFEPITNQEFYKIMLNILLEIFPEADRAASDWSRMFFGGKRLLTEVVNEKIFPEMLFNALYYCYSDNNKEKVQKIKKFAENNNIAIINKTFHTEYISCDNGKISDMPIIYNISNTKVFPSEIFVIYKSTSAHTQTTTHFSDNATRHISDHDICNNCKLMCEFTDGKRKLHYPELWGILTNLIHISGGKKIFKGILNKHKNNIDYNYAKWEANCTQISKCPYMPKRCADFCPYCDECKHGKNIITTVNTSKKHITILDNVVDYVDINTARYELRSCLNKAVACKDRNIHIIKAQTGIGKTYTYIDCIQNSKLSFIIAVPTNELKNEVYKRMIDSGIDVKMTPELPDDIEESERLKLTELFSKGNKDGYRKYINELCEKYESMREYKNKLKGTMNYTGNIVTTHFRLLYQFSNEVLEMHTIIIDEDIIQTMFTSHSINLDDVQYVLEQSYICGKIRNRIKYYSRPKENKKFKKHIAEPPINLDKDVQKHISKDGNINWNIPEFINSKVTMVDDDKVYYACLKDLPQQKIIIMSATINSEVYAGFFKNRQIKKYDIPEVKYKGTIKQWSQYSFSRNWIENNLDEYQKIKDEYKDRNCYEIGFKKFEDDNSDLHFGNTQGKDVYSDGDIVVLGTPYPNDTACKLMAAAMDCNMDDINKDSLNIREVRYDRYKFYITTFENNILKNIHIYHIASELEQAVGRARLLNKNNTVHVYSSFPVKQADFVDNEK